MARHHRICSGKCWSDWGTLAFVVNNEIWADDTRPLQAVGVSGSVRFQSWSWPNPDPISDQLHPVLGAIAHYPVSGFNPHEDVIRPLHAEWGDYFSMGLVVVNNIPAAVGRWGREPDSLHASAAARQRVSLGWSVNRLCSSGIGIRRGSGRLPLPGPTSNFRHRVYTSGPTATRRTNSYIEEIRQDFDNFVVSRVTVDVSFTPLAYMDEKRGSIGYAGPHHCCPLPAASTDSNADTIGSHMQRGYTEGCCS